MTTVDRRSARDRLLAAANELFYEEGVHTVGIDRVIERAGVAKASLYNTFGSKEELVRAYLTVRHESRTRRILAKCDEYGAPRERLLSIFDVLDDLFAEPGFNGCAFLNASAEARPGSSVERICDESRGWIRNLLTNEAATAGVVDPAALAEQLVLLYDGATVSAQMDRNRAAARAARVVASALVDAALAAAGPVRGGVAPS